MRRQILGAVAAATLLAAATSPVAAQGGQNDQSAVPGFGSQDKVDATVLQNSGRTDVGVGHSAGGDPEQNEGSSGSTRSDNGTGTGITNAHSRAGTGVPAHQAGSQMAVGVNQAAGGVIAGSALNQNVTNTSGR